MPQAPRIMVTNRLRLRRSRPSLLPPRLMYRYSRRKAESVMCQRRQNAVSDGAVYGLRKFCGKRRPNNKPKPTAMSA